MNTECLLHLRNIYLAKLIIKIICVFELFTSETMYSYIYLGFWVHFFEIALAHTFVKLYIWNLKQLFN